MVSIISSRKRFLLAIGVASVLLFSACHSTPNNAGERKWIADPCNDISYALFKQHVNQKREYFFNRYQKVSNHQKVVDSCRQYLESCLVDSVLLYWKNTEWDFYGTTQKPRCGKIACGYFVATALRDIGFRIPREKWAQWASEPFIRRFCGAQVKVLSNRTEKEAEAYAKTRPTRIFIAGLDKHVGFLIHQGNEFYFMHASYYRPEIGVIREKADGNNPFARSKYRVLGELFHDDMVVDWMKNTRWE